MPELVFRYGTMSSAKTANLIMEAHGCSYRGRKVLILKPSADTRSDKVASRCGLERDVDVVVGSSTKLSKLDIEGVHRIYVDECQFLSPAQIDQLRFLAEKVSVICYGLRSDYRNILFPGSRRLFAQADTIEEIRTECAVCGKEKATRNAKFLTGKDGRRFIVRAGSAVPDIGGDEKYLAMCWTCLVRGD